ncbi:ArnT family glycosyltransferase [Erythrobacter alti]|uniref:ArnT family glycosyltransferase n=1 Tax=Erythrobacter alti TaxID=1896145 RepID=UPI0030F3DE11
MSTLAATPHDHDRPSFAALLRSDTLPLALLAVLVLATRAIWFGDPVADFDEQLYSFIGWRMSEGELPFVDWWDRKPFVLFAIYAVSHALLGPGPLAYQLMAFAFALAGAVLTYYLARRLVGRFSAMMAGAISTMLLCAYASYSGQSEVFFLPLMLGMATLLVDPDHPRFTRRAMWAMLLGGLALQVKYTVLPQCAFFGLYALWVEHRRGSTLPRLAKLASAFVAFGLLPSALVALFYAAVGEFDAFLFANVLSFFDRMPAPQGRWAPDHWLGVSPLAVLAVGGFYAAFRMKRPEPFATWVFFCGWAAASVLTVLLPGTVYLYYYAAVAAPAALVALPLLDRRAPLRAFPALVLSAGFLALLALPDRYEYSLEERQAADELAAAIAPHVGADSDCLWLWDGPTALYRMTGSCVPTKFVYPDHLNNALETDALGVDQAGEVARVLATRPGAIVTASRPMTLQNEQATALVEAALAADYEERLSVEMHDRTLTAWIRRN